MKKLRLKSVEMLGQISCQGSRTSLCGSKTKPSKRFCHIAPPCDEHKHRLAFSQTHTQSAVSWLQWPESTLLAKATRRLPGKRSRDCWLLTSASAQLGHPQGPWTSSSSNTTLLTLDNQWLATPCRSLQNFNSLLSKKVIANPQHHILTPRFRIQKHWLCSILDIALA